MWLHLLCWRHFAHFHLKPLKPPPLSPPLVRQRTPMTSLSIPDNKEHEAERKEIEELLTNIETQWNAHNLDSVMSYYADDYINNDGTGQESSFPN